LALKNALIRKRKEKSLFAQSSVATYCIPEHASLRLSVIDKDQPIKSTESNRRAQEYEAGFSVPRIDQILDRR
jgi:hypothetical protein